MHMFGRCLLLSILLLATPAHAQWPERTVTLVVPFAAGGISDIITRVTAERLNAAFSRPFVVENTVGAGGVTATLRVARAAPDGYTVLAGTITQVAIAPFMTKVAYDGIKDFTPVSLIATSPFVITVGSSFPANTLQEFIDYVKARPGKLPYGAAGHGSMSHITAAAFLRRAGLEMTMVPYKGLAPAFADLLAGNIQMVSATPVELKPFIDGGKIKMLGSSGPKRSALLPDVPTIAETIPGHAIETWNGLLVPAGTSPTVVEALGREMINAHKSSEYRERLLKVGVDPVSITPAEFARLVAADTERWRKLVPELGLDQER